MRRGGVVAKARTKSRGSAAQEMFGHLRSAEGKKAKTTTKAGDKHPAIPGLVRKRGSAASDLYPYLKSAMSVLPGGGAMAKLLSDAQRQEVSPLGGVAKPAPKGRKR
jgi:hypothetical protein